MNLKNLFILSLIVLGSIATSCSKNESFEEKLGGLKQVVFPEVAEQIKSSKPTGRVEGNELEVIQTVTVQQTLAPVQIVDGKDLDVIYPGSVLDGESFLNGTYNPLVINNPQEITLSATLQGAGLPVNTKSKPVVSDVRQKVNTLINDNRNLIDYNNTASYLTYISNKVTTIESFNKSFAIHTKVNVLSGLVKANFSFEESSLTINSKKYVLIKVRQQFYNVTVDPKNADTWGDIQNIGSYEPVYISSVDYGRVAHLLVETDEKSSEVTKSIKAGIEANFAKIGGDANAMHKETARQYYKDKKIQIMIAGGPLSAGKFVTDYDSFMEFLTLPSPKDLVNSSAPIGYKVRTLKDNREVEVRTLYTEQRIYP